VPVYKRGGVWWVSVGVGGRQIRRSAGRSATKADARELEARIRASLHEHQIAAKAGRPPRRQFDEALLQWLQGDATRLKSYEKLLNHAKHIRPFTRGRWLTEGPLIAEEIKQSMLADHLNTQTINRRIAVVRRVLNLAYDWGWLTEQLGSRVKLLREDNERHYYLTPEEVQRLAEAAGDAHDAIMLAAYTGLRRSELLRLTEAHVREDTQGKYIILDPRTKNGRPRVIPLPEKVRHCQIPVGLSDPQLRKRFDKSRRAIGRPEIRFHDLRHSYASMLIQGNATPVVVRDLLGHSNLGVTSRYSHLATSHLWDAVRNLK